MISLTHPSDHALLALAQHEAPLAEVSALRAHLADCARCRSTVQEARDLTLMVKADWSPSATPVLLSRIEASREAGVSVILPDVEAETTMDVVRVSKARGERWGYWGGLAAAASVMIALWAGRTDRPDIQERRAPTATMETAEERNASFEAASAVFSALSPLPAVAQAQALPLGNSRPIDASLDGSKLAPGRWQYVTTQPRDDSVGTSVSTRSVVLERTTLETRKVWRIVTTDTRRGGAADTTFLETLDLRPIERRWHVGRISVRQEYGREVPDQIFTVATRTTTDATARATADTMRLAMNPTGVLIDTDAQLQLLFKTVRLDRDWRLTHGRSGMKVSASTRSAPSSRTLQVVGEDVIQLTRGSTPVWSVAYDGDARQTWYVSKASGELVRVAGTWLGSKERFRTDLQ